MIVGVVDNIWFKKISCEKKGQLELFQHSTIKNEKFESNKLRGSHFSVVVTVFWTNLHAL